jgi:hypothetical protein
VEADFRALKVVLDLERNRAATIASRSSRTAAVRADAEKYLDGVAAGHFSLWV